MANVTLRKVPTIEDRRLPIFAEAERIMKEVSRRAFDIFTARGAVEGHALDDWLAAEREICWPAGELVDQAKTYELSVALAGFAPQDVEVTATPREIIVHAKTKSERKEERKEAESVVLWSEFGTNDVYRRVALSAEIDPEKVVATLDNGLLKVVAPKAEIAVRKVPIASAA